MNLAVAGEVKGEVTFPLFNEIRAMNCGGREPIYMLT
jgi:hypothetical protein